MFVSGVVCWAVQGGSTVWVCAWNSKLWPFKWIYWAACPCGAVHYAVQVDTNFASLDEILNLWPRKWKLSYSMFLWCISYFRILQSENCNLNFEAFCFIVISSPGGAERMMKTHLEGTVQPGYLAWYILIQSTKTSPFQREGYEPREFNYQFFPPGRQGPGRY